MPSQSPPEAPIADLRARLDDLTIRDEHRIRRRFDRLRTVHGDEARGEALTKIAQEIEQSEARVARRRATVPRVSYPPQLPVSARKDELLAAIRDNQVVVVAGETGSGKTTQLPKICLELGRGVRGAIAHTQPRRLAARTVAERIAEELNVPLGDAVGYAVRFNDRTSEDTLVRLVTDGLLLAQIQRDPLLRRYDTIIVDEAHERSLNIDFLLGCIKRILPQRPELKLIITSATIDPQRFSRHFGDAPIVEVSGRTYPVEVRYRPLTLDPPPGARGDRDDRDERASAPDDRDQIDAIGDAVQELRRESKGDVLVFLSGEREIRDTADALQGRFGDRLDVLPLYARLATAEQQRVFRPHSKQRVVLATNVAETSLTVPGIRYVVDPGSARISRYSSRLKVQRLPIEAVSQASADQRKGRCGRQSDGICIRLYSEQEYEARARFTDPEILRTNLASVILQMAALGLGAIEQFPFLDPPDRRQVRDGVLLLQELGALAPPRRREGDGRSRELGALAPPRRREGDGRSRELGALAPPRRREGDGRSRELGALAPPRRREGDGRSRELGALEEGELTPLGRKLAQLPVDPRLGRMVLEGDRLGCASEAIVIAAALSIQDPRERPSELQAQADQQHARFRDDHSDFTAFLNVWRYIREQQRELSNSQFRKRLKREFLHYLRVREWQDLSSQLREAARGVGVVLNQQPAEPVEIHRALLSGLLSHVGVKEGSARRRGEYLGARGARFMIFPGSGQARRQPNWVMAAELVETSRLWGRVVARIEPEWVEGLAEHLVRRTHSEPRWEKRRSEVVATERVTLYGLPIVAGRTVSYSSIDPVLARELFIRRALVEEDWHTRHHFFHDNRQLIDELADLEHRARRRDILAGDDVLFAFYDNRVPADVVSGAHFDRWWRRTRQREPRLLTFTRELLIDSAAAAGALDERARPESWRQGTLELPLTYYFEPGAEHDGVTAHVPLAALAGLREQGFEWLVPAFRLELITTLIRSLPKELRRPLVPVPDVAAAVLASLTPEQVARAPLLETIAAAIGRLRGVRVAATDFDRSRLPAWLRMRFRIEDERGALIAEGDDLEALRARVRPRLQAQLTRSAGSSLERRGLRAWTLGTLPKSIELPGSGGMAKAYPALVDEGASVGVRVFDSPGEQWVAMRAGTRRLLLLSVPEATLKHVQQRLGAPVALALAAAPGGASAVLDDALTGAVDVLTAEAGGPAWDAASFQRLRDHVAGNLSDRTLALITQVSRILELQRQVMDRIVALSAPQFEAVRLDVARQLGRLVYPGFVTTTGVARLDDVERYLKGALYRLERVPDHRAADADRMKAVHELEEAVRQRRESWPPGRPMPAALFEVGWLIEELRISHFAQGLGVRGQVSSKRIRRLLAEAWAAA
ncbi:ATP-dependent RNA helicase HrpA [Conexibacter sp. CPCC 206217]|uniref:ATP-dependent RNA helicase HrpA n=1 Tax=Conexibacter sp. CPCC 206217 TaxID=3064574 RepID=UPI002722236B|nr:ATP-dependent RNA helicase HrpA [Conexibacter sp. CPCC 206217]MDO8211263.1 ATP-dependent RNA helicase HrpA [Conexibacter sp. CPCC 206217]